MRVNNPEVPSASRPAAVGIKSEVNGIEMVMFSTNLVKNTVFRWSGYMAADGVQNVAAATPCVSAVRSILSVMGSDPDRDLTSARSENDF